MHYVISFESKMFDLDNEEENPINPIKGKSVGEWITELLKKGGIQTTEIDAEDWGWYIYVVFKEDKYLVGFVGLPSESVTEAPEIIIQVDKRRSFIESILGKNKMTENDPLLAIIQNHINNLQDTNKIEVIANA